MLMKGMYCRSQINQSDWTAVCLWKVCIVDHKSINETGPLYAYERLCIVDHKSNNETVHDHFMLMKDMHSIAQINQWDWTAVCLWKVCIVDHKSTNETVHDHFMLMKGMHSIAQINQWDWTAVCLWKVCIVDHKSTNQTGPLYAYERYVL
jgi:hypothetical protein